MFLYFVNLLVTNVIYNTVLIVKNDFVAFKHFLSNLENLKNDNRFLSSLYRPKGNVIFPYLTSNSIYQAPKVLNILLECLDILNENFGITVLLFNISTVLNILFALNKILISEDLEGLDAENASKNIFQLLLLVVSMIESTIEVLD